MMKIVFMGTPEPAAQLLADLIAAKQEIVCVVTQPDRPKGRGQKITFPPVKDVALKHGLSIEQPEKLKVGSFISLIESLRPDIIVVVAYGKILPKEILDIPQYGCLNVHASLLPKYRGAAPMQWALLNGEKETGVTVMRLDQFLDTGDIILQKKIAIEENDDVLVLSKKIFSVGSKLLVKALKQINEGQVKYLQQNNAEATNAPLIRKESGEIDWRKTAREIHNRVRAMIPWPVAHTFFREKLLKIWQSEIHIADLETKYKQPGTIVQIVKGIGFIVATGAGHLLVKRVQLEGKKQMGAYEFVIGHDVEVGETLPN